MTGPTTAVRPETGSAAITRPPSLWVRWFGDPGRLSNGQRAALVAIVVLALVVRVAWCVYAARPPSAVLHDPNFYRFFGEQLAKGNGYRLPDGTPTAYYPVGYPASLAVAFWVVYHTPLPDHIETGVIAGLNIAYQVASVLLVFAIARRLVARVGAGLVAALLLALWPNLIFHTAVALTESLFILLLLAALFLMVAGPWAAGRFGAARLVATGVLLGLATMVRPVSVPVFPALGVAFLVAGWTWRRALVSMLVVTAVAACVLAPWAIRNAVVMHQVTLSTNTGDNLCMSRRVGGTGGFEFPNPRCLAGPWEALPRPAFETERDAHGRKLAVEFVKAHPGEEVALWWRRAVHTFNDDADGLFADESYGTDRFLPDGLRSGLHVLANVYGALAGLASLAGFAVLAVGRQRPRPDPDRLLVLLTALGILMPPLIFFGDPRFHVPAIPLAAVAIGVLYGTIAGWATHARATAPAMGATGSSRYAADAADGPDNGRSDEHANSMNPPPRG